MIQRTVIVAGVVVTLASLALLGMVWHDSNRAMRDAAEAARRSAEVQATNQAKIVELLTQSQSSSAEILKQLQAVSAKTQDPRSPDWIPVTLKLTLETPNGPPAAGYQVMFYGGSGLFDQAIERESGPDGSVDFGVVHPGDWKFELSHPRDEQYTWRCRGSLNVLPGTKIARTIVCPVPVPEAASVRLNVQWPADLAAKNLGVEATFVPVPLTFQPPLKWAAQDMYSSERRCRLLYGPEANRAEIGGSAELNLWCHYTGYGRSEAGTPVFADLRSQGDRPGSDSIAMERGGYVLRRLIVLRPVARQNAKVKGQRLEVLAHAEATSKDDSDVKSYSNDPDVGEDALGAGSPLSLYKGRVSVAPAYWRWLEGRFLVLAGQVNDWALPLPEELVNFVREQLAGNQDLKVEQTRRGPG
jgi:hypothetical protein